MVAQFAGPKEKFREIYLKYLESGGLGAAVPSHMLLKKKTSARSQGVQKTIKWNTNNQPSLFKRYFRIKTTGIQSFVSKFAQRVIGMQLIAMSVPAESSSQYWSSRKNIENFH